jgi:hypothetical protein
MMVIQIEACSQLLHALLIDPVGGELATTDPCL